MKDDVSCTPGSSISTRSRPCRWIEISLLPPGSIRRRSTSIDWSTARVILSVTPASVTLSWIAPSSVCFTSSVRPVVPPSSTLPIGCDRPCKKGSARSRSASLAKRTCAPRASRPMPPLIGTLFSRITRRESSTTPSTSFFVTSALSISISTCAPPCRSSPSTMGLNGTNEGRTFSACSRVSLGIRLGITSAMAAKVTSRMEMIFQVAKRSIGSGLQGMWCAKRRGAPEQAPSHIGRGALCTGGRKWQIFNPRICIETAILKVLIIIPLQVAQEWRGPPLSFSANQQR